MTFREKSAWAMGLLTLITGLYYLLSVSELATLGQSRAQLGAFIPYVLSVIAGSIVIQTVLAVRSPREAEAAPDERERLVIDRAGHWSGMALAAVLVTGVLDYLVSPSGDRLLTWAMAALIISQVLEYGLQIILFRRGH